jgi:phosphate transport system permease protein
MATPAPTFEPRPAAPDRSGGAGTPRRRLVADRAARWVVSAGGIAIILSILGILVFILIEVWPLTRGARVEVGQVLSIPQVPVGAVVVNEYRTHAAMLAATGEALIVGLEDGRVLERFDLLERAAAGSAEGRAGAARPELLRIKVPPAGNELTAATADGRVLVAPVAFGVSFEGDDRVVRAEVRDPVLLTLDPEGRPIRNFATRQGGDSLTVAAELADGTLALVRRSVEENFLGETTESVERSAREVPYDLTALAIDADQRNLYAGTSGGELLWWPLDGGQLGEPRLASAGAGAVTALSLLIGGRSLVVGQESGALSVWFPLRQGDGSYRLVRVRGFPAHPGAIREIAPSRRDKGFLALSAGGRLGLYQSTAHRVLWLGNLPAAGDAALGYPPKADAAYLAGGGRLLELAIGNPHPEVTWKTLFGKVWYEGYREPERVWQSSGGTDDFEPKLSLTPLLVGTLKGTFYSLLLAIPLGVFGAMYISQFMHPGYKRYVKPLIEIMASLPSVVLGFLAGLWLAPRVEQAMPGLILMLVVLPLAVFLAGYAWSSLPRTFRGRFPVGTEALLFVVVLAGAIWLCLELSGPVEDLAFGGSFQAWLLEVTGLSYDQRNAVVVGLAMGFAVIPIIFAIAEDAFSNVPPNLVAGSLALGADRWQTVTRVVLPTASPGIFSAVMVGFGRAVGETMIVLMATGNTPIMSWNPFNGFRTLSANIAVEIPEAPHAGTLYRTLFLAALLLFALTFLVNTIAEIVRQRLRVRYSQL